ncbi:MAG: ComF family protein [Rhizobacter sp.]|nr:ComF family protein [Rhizobacter sp.]
MFFTRLLQQLPSQCAVCRGWGLQAVCESCHLRYAAPAVRCERCALRVPAGVSTCGACHLDPPSFDAALAGVDYAHPWSTLIAQFKFRGALELAHTLVVPLLSAQQRSGRPAPDVLLPVPLSTQRLRQRGYNQAWEATRRLARALDLRSDAHLLLRLKDSPHQLSLPPEGRAANVRGVFAVEPARSGELQGCRVAIIDDVMTTGATFAEIAGVLKQAGAACVEVWALARTPRTSG